MRRAFRWGEFRSHFESLPTRLIASGGSPPAIGAHDSTSVGSSRVQIGSVREAVARARSVDAGDIDDLGDLQAGRARSDSPRHDAA